MILANLPNSETSKVLASPGLCVSRWPEEETAAVFSPETVRTHLVSALSAFIMEASTREAVSAIDIARLLGEPDGLGVSPGEHMSDLRIISETIEALKHIGLLRNSIE